MWVAGPKKPFLAQLALVGAARQGCVGLARGVAFDARERDVVLQAGLSSGLPDGLRSSMIVSNETIVKELVSRETISVAGLRPGKLPALPAVGHDQPGEPGLRRAV